MIEGQNAKITIRFDIDGEPVNPGSPSATVYSPSGAVLTPALTNPTTGKFTAIIFLDAPGLWLVDASGTTTDGVISYEEGFSVDPARAP